MQRGLSWAHSPPSSPSPACLQLPLEPPRVGNVVPSGLGPTTRELCGAEVMVFSCKAGIGTGVSPWLWGWWGWFGDLSALSSGGLWVGAALAVGSVPKQWGFSPVFPRVWRVLPYLPVCVHKVWGRRQHEDDFRFWCKAANHNSLLDRAGWVCRGWEYVRSKQCPSSVVLVLILSTC